MKIAILPLLCLPLISGVAAEVRTLFDKSFPGGFRIVELVGEESLAVARLQAYLADAKLDPPLLLHVTAADSMVSLGVLSGGKGSTEKDYAAWDHMHFARQGHEQIRALELLAIGNDAVVRIAERGKVSKVVLRGKDPTLLTVGSRHCELLTVRAYQLPHTSPSPTHVALTVWTDALPTATEALAITRELQARLHASWIQVDMRPDNWFIDDQFYPVWFPFHPANPPGSLAEYKSHGQRTCFGDPREVHCPR